MLLIGSYSRMNHIFTKTAKKQNNILWLETRQKSGIEQPFYDQKVLVWCDVNSEDLWTLFF